jgi:HD superfamily phosphodiesterase
MKESQLRIIADAKAEVEEIFATKFKPWFVFHTIVHTTEVAEAAEAMASFYQLNDEEKFILLIAAWFHDTGFSKGRIEEHEKESIKIAKSFLTKHMIHESVISKVASCIQATVMPQHPVLDTDKIICDADLFHLGTKRFMNRTELLRQELQAYYKIDITETEWRLKNIEFLKSHRYFTGYCQQMLEPVKQQWIMKLEKTKPQKPGKRMYLII